MRACASDCSARAMAALVCAASARARSASNAGFQGFKVVW
jgi:hypothetical protein